MIRYISQKQLTLEGFQAKAPFGSSFLGHHYEIRKRMGQTVFDEFHEATIQQKTPCRYQAAIVVSVVEFTSY